MSKNKDSFRGVVRSQKDASTLSHDDDRQDSSSLFTPLHKQGEEISSEEESYIDLGPELVDEPVLISAKDAQPSPQASRPSSAELVDDITEMTNSYSLPTFRGGKALPSIASIKSTSSPCANCIKGNGTSSHPTASSCNCTTLVTAMIQQTTLADQVASMHFVLYYILNNGRTMALVLAGLYLGFLCGVWFPLRVWAFVVTEIGVYISIVLFVYVVGQYVVRWLVFPGSSYKIQQDISAEFGKYSLRVLENAIQVGLELANHVNKMPSKSSSALKASANTSSKTVHVAWRRMEQYRNRIFVVYCNVLTHVYGEEEDDDQSESAHIRPKSKLKLYGNNPIRGDIRPYPHSSSLADEHRFREMSFPAASAAHLILSHLRRIIHTLDKMEQQYFSTHSATAEADSLNNLSAELTKHCVALRSTLRSISLSNTNSDTADEEEGGRREAFLERGSAASTVSTSSTSSSAQSKYMQGFQAVTKSLSLILDPFFEQANSASYDVNNNFPSGDLFNMHVLRGTFLSRYIGARQFWIPNSHSGGFIDCVVIPPSPQSEKSDTAENEPKAVLYCNPNAGLYEVATGMNLMGGNTAGNALNSTSTKNDAQSDPSNNWTDFYLRQGYHVVLFNYSGYGRSHGGVGCSHCYSYRKGSHQRNTQRTNLSRIFYQPISKEHELDDDYEEDGVFDASPRSIPLGFWRNWIERKAWRRIPYWFCFGFKPTPSSLRADALCVAHYVNDVLGITKLAIHGESIGGMAAAATAKNLTKYSPENDSDSCPIVSLLVCDRTFCNLEATAQRLVGGWSGYAIRALTRWSTDVAADFQASQCPKVVATDAADVIIADASSLKSGLAMSEELCKGEGTKFMGWLTDMPLRYKMADWEGLSVSQSTLANSAFPSSVPPLPVWPADKHISYDEAFHFAACVRRIGKVSTYLCKKKKDINDLALSSEGGGEDIETSFLGELVNSLERSSSEDDEDSISLHTYDLTTTQLGGTISQSAIVGEIWKDLSLCDGFCGLPLGVAAKNGADCVVAWLCASVVFGCQIVAASAEARCQDIQKDLGSSTSIELELVEEDFSNHLAQIIAESERKGIEPPCALNVIAQRLRSRLTSYPLVLKCIEHELKFCIGVLEYVQFRLSSKQVLKESIQNLHCRPLDEVEGRNVFSRTGSFFRLSCGHNNHFSNEEKVYLASVLKKGA